MPIPKTMRAEIAADPFMEKGLKYNKLTAIEFVSMSKHKKPIWLFKCDCGKIKKIVASKVKSGSTKGCGCLRGNKPGKLCYAWKGDSVGYNAVHAWVRKHKPKPKLCEDCKKVPPYDLANKSQKYKRDINDFEWLCRKCHMIKDGRLEKFKKVNCV